ncbi:hypothetical protein SAMN05892877_101298 [Rhizobium subbaraonis]|uniref:DUF6644 domain-containing protein n=1 Tax=Rhizobium subbaraonis TaxID=908946 RepID=A0A285U061_9HYPH|nr:DUF6644 family protein [Rhizobium subbaraonis]SOC35324.1 hypothetical protein SAMN05892877_101298 [Rhizobium subbaraonis]
MEALDWIATSKLAGALKASATLYLFVNAAHILSIGALFGAILALDLRLLGFAPKVPLASVASYLSRVAAAGLALAIVTGLCLFSVRPAEYAGNPAFLAKLGLIALGLANVAAVHRGAGWRAVLAGAAPGPALRLAAATSLLVWIAAVVAGRWIGFL